MKAKTNNLKTLAEFKDEFYGKTGTEKRDKLEKGLTQEELAHKSGTTKSYISRIENNVKEVRFSTLQKIVELGLGGKLELAIKL